jgi:Flp pilus assembly protein TadD
MTTFRILTKVSVVSLCVASCAGYQSEEINVAEPQGELSTSATFGSGPEQVWIEKAKENFRHGEYGLAERYFRQATEERRSNVEAWLGLAASYDHLKRFDEADRAYAVLRKLIGPAPEVLNNLGYHYMLKGEFAAAERTLLEAREKDPYNPSIRANLVLLDDWKAAAGKRG